MTPVLLEELRQVLARDTFGLDPDAVRILMADMESCATIVYPTKFRRNVTRDSDDDAVVDCAVESDSPYIVSGDSWRLSRGCEPGTSGFRDIGRVIVESLARRNRTTTRS